MSVKRILAYLFAGWMGVFQCMLIPAAQASMVGTDQMLAGQQRQANIEKIMHALDRKDAARALASYGVKPDEVKTRLNRLTDQELAQLADKSDHLPAGGDVLGAVILVFFILIILDLLGVTNIFPAIHPINTSHK